jgi:hypothetical protein
MEQYINDFDSKGALTTREKADQSHARTILFLTVFPLIVPDPPSSLSSHLRQKAKVPKVLFMCERSFFALGKRRGT